MDIGSLQRQLKSGGVKPVYIVQGDEQLLVEQAVRAIITAAVGDPDDAMSVTRVDLADGKVSAQQVVGACRSIGLFTPKQAVVVRAGELLDKKPKERDAVAAYISNPVAATTLIIKATKLNGVTALVKRTKKVGAVLKFDALKPRQAIQWLSGRARELGHRIDYGGSQLVGDRVGTGLLQLENTLQQLSLYVGPGKPITEADVENLLSATRSHSVFELVDAVGARDARGALGHLGAMMSHREPALRILAMLIRHFRILAQLQGLQRGGVNSPDRAASALRLHPFVAKKMWPQAKGFNPMVLRDAFERLYGMDVLLKSSKLSDRLLMERLVLTLCGRR